MPFRVLASDAQERSVLAAIRCLAASGFTVSAVAASRQAPGLWSVAPARRLVAPDPRADTEGFVRTLETILGRTPHDLLLPGTDASLLTVSRHRDRLEPYVTLGLPSREAVERSLDREQLGIEAAQAGLSFPESRGCRTSAEAALAARELGYPVLVKPVQTVVESAGFVDRRSTVLAHDDRAAQSAATAFGSCIVQRRLEGSVVSVAGVATDDGLVGIAVSRYWRTWPPEAGNVCFSETISCPPGLAERVGSLVNGLGWRGMFELELMERPGAGFAALDFNPRPYGSLSLAVAAGVPLPSMWTRWVLGGDPTAATPRIGVRYRWEDGDLKHLVWQARRGHATSALSIARPRRRVVHAYFRARDPAPLVARAVELARRAIRPVEPAHPGS